MTHDVLEVAELTINPADCAAFEAAVMQAEAHFHADPGCRSFALRRCIEQPGRYLLTVGWESIEAHTVAFRNSPNFAAWRALAGPFFVSPPSVQHYQTIGSGAEA